MIGLVRGLEKDKYPIQSQYLMVLHPADFEILKTKGGERQ